MYALIKQVGDDITVEAVSERFCNIDEEYPSVARHIKSVTHE